MTITAASSRTSLLPDPTFYASPRDAMKAPVETLAYVAVNDPRAGRPDAIAVIDCDSASDTKGQLIGRLDLPHEGDELHHFGWNACSAALCPSAPHPHVRRRYLVVPGLRSSRIYVLDTEPDPAEPHIVKVIEPEQLMERTGYSRPHTVHCGPDGIYMSALGNAQGEAPGGVFLLDHDSFEPLGAWEIERGPQRLAYDFWWHLGYDTMVTSEWGTPSMVETGLQPELLLNKQYGSSLHFWDLRRRRHVKQVQLGENNQLVLELRPAHDPTKAYGFVGVVVSLDDLSSSIWMWYREGDDWKVRKIIEIPAEPAAAEQLPPLLKGFNAVPPLLTDINLSLDDRTLFAACWGTGELRRYDVSDPFNARFVDSVHLGGIVRRTPRPGTIDALNGGPQMIEVSRDGRRVYLTNSLYLSWDEQFYPDGIRGWLAKIDVTDKGGLEVDNGFFIDFGERRPHQVRLKGGDASSDSYCFP